MKKNIIYILLIIVLLLVIASLVLVIINLYNRSKTPIPAPQPVVEKVVTRPQTVDFSKYGIIPREAMYYE